jgi:hypothetical protein
MGNKDEGLTGKFRVERLTPSTRGIDHTGCRYFVLDPQHDPSALFALTRYSHHARAEGYAALADDLDEWLAGILRGDS